jgi:hypothetical protein
MFFAPLASLFFRPEEEHIVSGKNDIVIGLQIIWL